MLSILACALILGSSSSITAVAADSCTEISGNWYCSETQQVNYVGLGGTAGSYQRVTNMDASSCTCTTASQSFSGTLSPLDEDLSIHFRGPIQLAQFAAYSLTSSSSSSSSTSKKRKRATRGKKRGLANGLIDGWKRGVEALQKREQYIYTLIPPIYTTSNDASTSTTLSSISSSSSASSTSSSSTLTTVAAVNPVTVSSTTTSTSPTVASTTATTTTTTVPTSSTSSVIWKRKSYYNAAAGVMDNTVFMNNKGGVNGDNGTSGTWSSCFGNSLSYASTSGLSTSSSPILLGDVTLPSDEEVIIFSGEACTTATCGYVADGVPAYVGFGGSDKLFLFEFSMPSDAANIGTANGDMPAIWMLNAQIPRSQQYGACSCWTTGCGELDLFEILSGGSDYLTTTFHSTLGHGGATSNYFERPTTSYMKAAVIFIGATKEIQIIVLDNSIVFSDKLANDVYETWQQTASSDVTLIS